MSEQDFKPIFLSYARIDNDKNDQDIHVGWVEYFCSRLCLALSPKLGKRFEFWRDVHEIPKSGLWFEPIKAALADAKVLLPILSPSFLASSNCRWELQHFIDHHLRHGASPEAVIKVLKHQINISNLPQEPRETEPFEFFMRDREKGELSYYTTAIGLREDRQQIFMDELERLANRLASLLKQAGQIPADTPRATTFMAVPYPDSPVNELYCRVKAELEHRNIEVLPDRKQFFVELDRPDPILLEQAVTNAQIAVHLLDPSASQDVSDFDSDQLEVSAARARAGTKLQRLIWVKPGSIDENSLVSSLRQLEANGGCQIEGDRLIQQPLEDFIGLLIRTLLPNEVAISLASAVRRYYLLYSPEDEKAALSIGSSALESRGLQWRLPAPVKFRPSDGVAIFWGQKDAAWIFAEMDRLQGTCPMLVIKGPPATDEKRTFRASELEDIIDSSNETFGH
jgi:hypothetical protein